VKRNKGRVLIASAMGLLVLTSVAVSTWQAMRLRAEQARTQAQRQEADRRREQAEAAEAATAEVNRFLTDMLGAAHPNRAKGKPVLVLDVLEAASRNLDERFAKQPVVERQLRIAIAHAFVSLGKNDLAQPHYQRSVVLSEQVYGGDSIYTFWTRRALAQNLYQLDRPAEAERMLLALLADAARNPAIDAREALSVRELLAYVQRNLNQPARADQTLREVLQIKRELFGPDSISTVHTLAALGSSISAHGNRIEGEAMAARGRSKSNDASFRPTIPSCSGRWRPTAACCRRWAATAEAEPMLSRTPSSATAASSASPTASPTGPSRRWATCFSSRSVTRKPSRSCGRTTTPWSPSAARRTPTRWRAAASSRTRCAGWNVSARRPRLTSSCSSTGAPRWARRIRTRCGHCTL
jgi:tetratricopeptide (TPR) repeat protein